jgi:type II protein arginine methyltransferase
MLSSFDFLSTASQTSLTSIALNGKPAAVEDFVPDIQQTWEFSHPISPKIIEQSNIRRGGSAPGGGGGIGGGEGANEHNSRFWRGTFQIPRRGVCHGLAGYFETVLYASQSGEKVELSTNPLTMDEKSKDMISWFPIFFPLKQPIYLPDHSEVDISMWRITDDRKVWYEWMLESWTVIGGQRLRLGYTEMRS